MPDAMLAHYGNVINESNGLASEVFEFTNVDGKRDRAEIPRDVAASAPKVRLELLRRNAALPAAPQKAMTKVLAVIDAPPRRLFREAARTGWREDLSAFVAPWGVIDSKQNRSRKLLPPHRVNEAQRRRMEPTGDLEGWIDSVARPCGYSDLAMTTLAMACAAPLLNIIGWSSFAVNLCGRSKTGKSIVLLAGSSFGGPGAEEDLPDWAATAPARGELFRLHTDILMPLNEIGLLSANIAHTIIGPTIYAIAQGREREKHSGSPYATTDASLTFRTIGAFSSERSIDDIFKRAGIEREEGERARCTDIPAVRGGRATVIDRFPEEVPPDRQTEWARRALRRLRAACRRHHGVALRPYVVFLMADPPRAMRLAERYVACFLAELDTASMSEAEQHAAGNFALILAGGCIAVDAGVLPYRKADLLRAILTCFESAVRTAAKRSDPLLAPKRLLRSRLQSDGVCNLGGRRRFDPRRHEGYRDEVDGRLQYVIHAAAFRTWFSAEPAAFEAVLDWLVRKGCLRPRRSRSTGVGQRPAGWAERVVEWPSGKPTRSIVFFDPFGG
jgi:hypothetical protein